MRRVRRFLHSPLPLGEGLGVGARHRRLSPLRCACYKEEVVSVEGNIAMSQSPTAPTIDQLPELIAALPERERELADRLLRVVVVEGQTSPPPEMELWIVRTFGSVEAVLNQRIVRVTNRWTFEGATFNALRSRRPGAGAASSDPPYQAELDERIEQTRGDDFCQPEQRTTADTFGRVRGERMLTASNVAKADGWHGVAIFDEHNPLAIDAGLVADLFAVAPRWAARARETDPAARHLFTLWNCLWRAGASQIHGHAQMTLSRGMAHARVEAQRTAAARYRAAYGATGGDYFADLAAVHTALGLGLAPDGAQGIDSGVAVVGANGEDAASGARGDATQGFASLTPVKEREVILLAPGAQPDDLGALAAPLWRTLDVALHQLGVRSFDVVAYGPPLGAPDASDPADANSDADWAGFPLVARFVDRGAPLSPTPGAATPFGVTPTSDIGALELYGSSVIASDPFDVARALRGETLG